MPSRSPDQRVFTFASFLLVMAGVIEARAEKPEKAATARTMFKEARQLAAEGHYQAACALFEQSYELEAGIGTEFNWADCLEHQGRTASARRLFLQVATVAKEQNQPQREQAAMERADRLLTRLTRLQVQCDGTCPQELRVYRNDVELVEASWVVPTAVDPGHFRVEVGDRKRPSWSTRVSVPADPVTIMVPVASVDAQSPPSQTPATPPKSRVFPAPNERSPLARRPPQPAKSSSASPSSSLWPAALFGVGIGGLALGTTASVVLRNKNHQAIAICPASEDCTSGEISRHDTLVGEAKWARVGVYAGFGLGVAGLASAAVLHFWGGTSKRERSPAQTAFQLSPLIPAASGEPWGVLARRSW